MDLQTALDQYAAQHNTDQNEKLGGIGATCPHCQKLVSFDEIGRQNLLGHLNAALQQKPPYDARTKPRAVIQGVCPNRECGKVVIVASEYDGDGADRRLRLTLLWPAPARPAQVPPGLSAEARSDYLQACAVLHLSPKAAAVLARRCLQVVLREKLRVKPQSLNKEIEEALSSQELTKGTRDSLDDIRTIGNWGAHPSEDPAVTMRDVKPEEARYTIDTLELLFGDLYVTPARIAAMKSGLATRSTSAGVERSTRPNGNTV